MNTLPEFATLRLHRPDEHLLGVELHRPEVGNAISTQLGQDLLDLWLALTADPGGLRCVLLSGAGERIFCSGGDLKERNGMTREQWLRQHEVFERAYWAMVDLPLPLIGAVNGHAYGGGLELALCCDFVYASRGARFAFSEVTLGIMPGMGGTQTLARAVGERRAKELIMTGRPFDAAQALQWGLVNDVFDDAQAARDAALATARTIAGNAPLAVRQVKKSIRYGLQMELRTAFRFEVEAYNHLVDTADRREGVLAFNEKRRPRFEGK